ncbi:cx9C motif-containing protein 4 isoform X1 [Harpegnathos saltator]|uniref:cx9C motif-containing protein 4 isoform X1 n=1 Tax=Harpegnathos saltator TaxID=610380 RepID=UPI00058D9ADD|nr:cx9C motif-containing protein 4 isoform X1 [Harpegnathos saltator]
MTTVDPCKQFACKLQKCLNDNIYQPSHCQSVIEELRICCKKHTRDSLVCDGIDITRQYQHNTIDFRKALR